jgi:hypothetical protein
MFYEKQKIRAFETDRFKSDQYEIRILYSDNGRLVKAASLAFRKIYI